MECPDCGKEVSENAYSCPHCGEDIEKDIATEKIRLSSPIPSPVSKHHGENHKACGCLVLILILLAGAMIAGTWFIITRNSNDDADPDSLIEQDAPEEGPGPEDSF